MGSRDLPFQSDEPGQVERADRYEYCAPPKTIELPGPDERHRAYQELQARVDAEAAEQSGQAPESGRQPKEADQRSGGIDQRSYWDEVPRFLETWADHQRRWPADRQPTADRSADPPGSHRSHGGFYLNPDRHLEAADAIARVCEAEPSVSTDVKTAEQENRYGGWLDGFEHCLKGEDRLKEKIAEGLATTGPDATPKEILQQVPDAIRYTFCFEPESYTRGYYDIKTRLESLGYEMYQSKNSWDVAEYKGINTRWVTHEGQRFEVQLHTPESFHVKHHITHSAYERLRNPRTTDEERRELDAFQREVSSRIHIPDGAADIPDFKKEGF